MKTAAEGIKKIEEGVDFTGEKLSDGADIVGEKMTEGVDKTKEIAANFMDDVFDGVKGLFNKKNTTDDFRFSFKLF